MHVLSFLHNAVFIATILIDTLVLVFSFSAYRRTKMQAFGLLILGSAVGIMLTLAQMSFRPDPYNTANDLRTFWIVFMLFSIVSIVSWGIAIYQLIQFVMSKIEKKDKSDV